MGEECTTNKGGSSQQQPSKSVNFFKDSFIGTKLSIDSGVGDLLIEFSKTDAQSIGNTTERNRIDKKNELFKKIIGKQ